MRLKKVHPNDVNFFCPRKYVEKSESKTTSIFSLIEIIRKKYIEMTWKSADIFLTYQHNVDIESTPIRCGVFIG